MIIDAHVHVMSCRSLEELGDRIETTADLVAFRTRHPDVFMAARTEEPLDNSDRLVADMDRHGISHAMVWRGWARSATRRGPGRPAAPRPAVRALQLRQGPAGDGGLPRRSAPIREQVVAEIGPCMTELGFKGMGETFIRTLTNGDPSRADRPRPRTDHGRAGEVPGADPDHDGVDAVARRPVVRRPDLGRRARRSAPGCAHHPHQDGAGHPDVLRPRPRGRPAQRERLPGHRGDDPRASPHRRRQARAPIGSCSGRIGPRPGTGCASRRTSTRCRLGVVDTAGLPPADREHVLWKTAVTVFRLPVGPEADGTAVEPRPTSSPTIPGSPHGGQR